MDYSATEKSCVPGRWLGDRNWRAGRPRSVLVLHDEARQQKNFRQRAHSTAILFAKPFAETAPLRTEGVATRPHSGAARRFAGLRRAIDFWERDFDFGLLPGRLNCLLKIARGMGTEQMRVGPRHSFGNAQRLVERATGHSEIIGRAKGAAIGAGDDEGAEAAGQFPRRWLVEAHGGQGGKC